MVARKRLLKRQRVDMSVDTIKITQKLKQIEILVSECLADLSNDKSFTKGKTTHTSGSLSKKSPVDKGKIDFSIPLRPFAKKYTKGMNGSQKFTLILAKLTDGNLEKKINIAAIEQSWSSMTAIMGVKYNRFYSQGAKDNDWVISEKIGIYSLRPSWLEIFN